jgi:hypothetical protein
MMPGPILAIASPSNDSGKTTLMAGLIKRSPSRWQAAKITTIYFNGNCPRDPDDDDDCACHQLRGRPWMLVSDPLVLGRDGTDTGRMLAAGARPVLWGLARPGHHPELWQQLVARLDPGLPLVTEGGQITRYLDLAALIVVANPFSVKRWKDDAEALFERADLVIINPVREGRFVAEDEAVTALFERLGERALLMDVSQPANAWPWRCQQVIDRVLVA